MGTAAVERVAISIETTARLEAAKAARAELGSLGQAAKAATQEMASAASQGGAAENALAAATNKVSITAEQSREAWAKAGGDYERFRAIIRKMADDQRSLAAASQQATAAQTAPTGAGLRGAGGGVAGPAALVAEIENIPRATQRGAAALAQLANAATSTTPSISGTAVAVGNLSSNLATLSRNARIAAGASGIGAIVTVLGVAYGLWERFKEGAEHAQDKLKGLRSEIAGLNAAIADNPLKQRILEIERAAESEIEETKKIKFHDTERAAILDAIVQKRDKLIQLAQQEDARSKLRENAGLEAAAAKSAEQRYSARVKLIVLEQQEAVRRGADPALAAAAAKQQLEDLNRTSEEAVQGATNQVAGLIGQLGNIYDARRRQVAIQYDQEKRAVDTLTLTDANRVQILEAINNQRAYGLRLILEEEGAQRKASIAAVRAQSENVKERFEGRLAQIDQEREAEIKRTGDVVGATAVAEQKKRELIRETARQANADAKTIFTALQDSHNKSLQAIGAFGDSVRRIIIGAEAARALVRAAVEGGEAIGSLAVGDFRGAALHGAAALQLGAAAAQGFRESLGGGGGGTAASGGGGGGVSGGTYTPREREGTGGMTVIIQTVSPTDREVISEVSYQLQRSGVTKRPIYQPSTNRSREAVYVEG